MKIDEAISYVLTKYSKVRGKTILTESDHNPIICQFNYLWNDATVNEKQRYEVFNFKDTDGLLKFNELTSADTLSACFNCGDIKVGGKKWLKAFKTILHRSFKKIRINNKQMKNEEVYNLMKAKTQILERIQQIKLEIEQKPENIHIQSKILVNFKDAVDNLDKKIADLCAKKNMKTIQEHYENITDVSGNFNIPKMWGLKKKLNLGSNDVPSAKKDKAGNLITTKKGLIALYQNT